MEPFQLYFVATQKIKPGKGAEAARWWREKGQAVYESMPGVNSVKAYGTQFGLGSGDYALEIWMELDAYAALDQIDRELEANPGKYAAFGEMQGILEGGPSRVMGDWPESHWSPDEG